MKETLMNEILSRIKIGFGIFIEIEMRKKWVVRQMRFAGNLKENWKGASICCFYVRLSWQNRKHSGGPN